MKALAAAQPHQRALGCEDAALTYSEFVTRAQSLARTWLDQGLEPGDRVALHLRNGIDLAVGYFACFAAGLVAVPVNNRLLPAEIAYILEHSGARAYVSQPELRIDTGVPSFGLEGGAGATPMPPGDADAPALLLYTSGTTARPKGVCHTQRTLAGNASYMESWGITPADHTLIFTSMAHASGAIMLLISSLWIGCTVTVVPVFEAADVLDTWERSGATFCMGLPTLLRGLVAEQRARPRHLSRARLAICGGDAVPIALQDEYGTVMGHPLVEGFGMTEGLPTLANRPGTNRPGSMGQALGDIELRVVGGGNVDARLGNRHGLLGRGTV